MKRFVTCFIILLSFQFTGRISNSAGIKSQLKITRRKIYLSSPLMAFDGREVFTGFDPRLMNEEKYTADSATIKMLYDAPNAEGRRKKLLPFFWNVIAQKGQLYGNRLYNNDVNTSNLYSISYPGYNEIFTGNTDINISSNARRRNRNLNVLEFLNDKADMKGKVVAFTSWDVFPFILNDARSHIILNSGYEKMNDSKNAEQNLIDKVQDEAVTDKTNTRHDLLTFLTAKEYIRTHQPKIVFLGLGETDEAAHEGRYDTYLEKAAEADHMIAELWHWVQTTPGYKDHTTFIITTDHGRGKKVSNWTDHGVLINGSSQTWIAIMGPHISPLGEIKDDQQIYQEQLAQTMAALLGEEFVSNQPIAAAIPLKGN
jgi:hypothetical protein